MSFVHLTFHPNWWASKGFSFTRNFFENYTYRIEIDRTMRRVLYENYGHLGLGEKDPAPRPILDSPFISAEYLQSEILGCEVDFINDDFPVIYPLNANYDTLKQISKINLTEHPAFLRMKTQMENLVAQFGYVESFLDLHGVQNLALDIRGNDLYEDYYFDQDTANLAIKAAYRCIATVTEQVLQFTSHPCLGVAPLLRDTNPQVIVTSNCTCEMISQQIYKQFLQKYDKALAQNHPFGIHHCGCTMQNIAEAYAELQPQYLEVGTRTDLNLALQPFSANTIVSLHMTADELNEIEKTQIKHVITQKFEYLQNFSQHGISCVSIREKTPPEKLEEFVQVVNQL